MNELPGVTDEQQQDLDLHEAIEWAKENHQPEIGSRVAHPNDEYIYRLNRVVWVFAFVSRFDKDTNREIRRRFKMSELFDVDAVKKRAITIQTERILGKIKFS